MTKTAEKPFRAADPYIAFDHLFSMSQNVCLVIPFVLFLYGSTVNNLKYNEAQKTVAKVLMKLE